MGAGTGARGSDPWEKMMQGVETMNTGNDWDRDHIIHPLHPVGQNPRVAMEKGHGVVLQDTEGKEYLDCRAQLACVNLGYGRQEIINAAVEQMNKLQYTTLFHGFTNPVAVECAQRLSEVVPEGLAHFVFTSGGSESIESAFRIARLFWHYRSSPKHKIISLYDSYHGLSLGAATATGMGKGAVWSGTGPTPSGFLHVPSYDCYHCMFGKEYPGCDIQCARFLEETIVKEGPDSVAAFIAEPELGVGGMIPPPPEYWPRIREICTRHNVLLIADEVMTGFGRTGKLFAVENWGIRPDMLVMAKGITSAYLPFGAVAFSDDIFDSVKGTYMLGFTYAGHPVCAAASIKCIEIYREEGIAENAAKVGKHVMDRLHAEFGLLPCVDNISGLGLMLGFNLVGDKATRTPLAPEVSADVESRALAGGVLVRCMNAATAPGSRICFTPPLTMNIEEADRALDILKPIVAGLRPG